MPCSPTYLFIDMIIWLHPQLFPMLVDSYRNLSQGDKHDCGMTSVNCESNLTKSLVTTDPNVIFWFDNIFGNILTPSVCCLGIFGNVMNIVILSRNDIATDSTNTLLLATSISDLLHSLWGGISGINNFLCFFDEVSAIAMFNLTGPHGYYIVKWLGVLSLDFVTVMSLQRAAAVAFPFKVKRIFTHRNTCIIIAILVILYLCVSLPMHIPYRARYVYHPHFGQQIPLGYNHAISFRIRSGIYNPLYFVRGIVDLFLLIVSGSVTVYKLNIHVKNRAFLKASTTTTTTAFNTNDNKDDTNIDDKSKAKNDNKTKKTTSMSDREIKVVKLSIGVCYTSFVIYFIECVSSIQMTIYGNEVFSSSIPVILMFASKFFGDLACSFNFVLYMIMSQQFRDAFIKMFTPTKKNT